MSGNQQQQTHQQQQQQHQKQALTKIDRVIAWCNEVPGSPQMENAVQLLGELKDELRELVAA